MSMKIYSLKKSSSFFFESLNLYNKNKNKLTDDECKKIEFRLEKLHSALRNKDKYLASKHSRELLEINKKKFKIPFVKKLLSGFFSGFLVSVFALSFRQTFYEWSIIPTGSMRPTFRESDIVVISHSQFGINTPFNADHMLFSEEEVKRMGIIALTAQDLPMRETEVKYLGVIPAYKQMTKRMIGLPGDKLYFYGGKIYGIDKNGNDISNDLQIDKLSHIDHIPYIRINGNIKYENNSGRENYQQKGLIKQNNIELASVELLKDQKIKSHMKTDSDALDIHELWGMGNYAMAKIIDRNSLRLSSDEINLLVNNPSTKYFLELTHHASIKNLDNLSPKSSLSYIPLDDEALKTLWENIYTARFRVNKGYMQDFQRTYSDLSDMREHPYIGKNIEDGYYEFINGTVSKLRYQNTPFSWVPSLSIPQNLEDDHPLAKFSPKKCVMLFNLGVNPYKILAERNEHGTSRYAYFRDGDLFLLGKKIFSKKDNTLTNFNIKELQKEEDDPSYTPFIDSGAPLLSDGSIDSEKINNFGLSVPKNSYYVLGDNHSQSGDSREFGMVPKKNLRGITALLVWAPDSRAGAPLQINYQTFTLPKIIMWTIFILISSGYYYVRRVKKHAIKKLPFKKVLKECNTLIFSI